MRDRAGLNQIREGFHVARENAVFGSVGSVLADQGVNRLEHRRGFQRAHQIDRLINQTGVRVGEGSGRVS